MLETSEELGLKSYDDWSDLLGGETESDEPSSSLVPGEALIQNAKATVAATHPDDARIPTERLFNGQEFRELADAADGHSLYVYVHSGDPRKQGNPDLWVFQNIESVKLKHTPTLWAPLLPEGQILANVVTYSFDPKQNVYVRQEIDTRVSVWPGGGKIFTIIEGQSFPIIESFDDIDAFVIPPNRQRPTAIITDVFLEIECIHGEAIKTVAVIDGKEIWPETISGSIERQLGKACSLKPTSPISTSSPQN